MKRKLAIVFAFTLFFNAAAFAQTALPQAKDYFDRAIVSMSRGDFAQAIVDLRAAAKLEPNRYEIWANLGNAFFAFQRFNDAEHAFQKAKELKPQDAAAHFNLCRALAAQKKTYLAVPVCQEAIRLDGNQELYYVLLAEIRMANTQAAEALQLLVSVADKFETSVAIAGYLGDLYFQDGDLGRAVEFYEKVVRLKPDLAIVYLKVSDVYLKLNRVDEAITAAQRYVELNVRDAGGYSNLGRVLQETGYVEQSIPAYQKAIQLKPNDGFNYYNLGEAFETLGEKEKALEVLQIAYRYLPNNFSIASKYGKTLTGFGKMNEAVEPLKRAVSQNPDDFYALQSLGLALFESNRFEDALTVLNKADNIKPNNELIQMFLRVTRARQIMAAQFGQIKNYAEENPKNVKAGIDLANAYRYINRSKEAEDVYANLIKQNPNDYNVYNWFGIFLSDTGQNEKSLAAFRRAAELNPHHVLYLSVSSQLEKLGRNAEALAAIDKSIEIKATLLETHMARGDVLQKLGRREDALQAYLNAYNLAPGDARPNFALTLMYVKLGNKEAAVRHFEILKSVSPAQAQQIGKVVSAVARKSSVKFLTIKS